MDFIHVPTTSIQTKGVTMKLPTLGETVTLQQFIELAPKGLELTSPDDNDTIYYDLDTYISLGNPSNHTKQLTKEAISEFIPGYLWRNLSTKQHLEGAWCYAASFKVSKLPSIAAIKRKPL